MEQHGEEISDGHRRERQRAEAGADDAAELHVAEPETLWTKQMTEQQRRAKHQAAEQGWSDPP